MSRKNVIHLALPAAGTSLVLSLVCALGVLSLNRLESDRTSLLAKDVASLEAAQEIEVRLRQVRFHALVYIMEPTPFRQAPLDEDHRQFEAAMERAVAAVDSQEERELLAAVRDGYARYRGELNNSARRPAMNSNPGVILGWADSHPVRPLLDTCEELVAFNRRSLERRTEQNGLLTHRTRVILVLAGILGPLAGLVGGIAIARIWWQRWNRHQRELARAEQMAAVGHLAAGVAHEIRNPLTGMKLLIQAAVRSNRRSELTADELRMILDDVAHVERTVQGLLDFSKPPSTCRKSVNPLDAVRQIVDRERGRAALKSVNLQVASGDHFKIVSADPDQLSSLISNVVINAIEASPPAGTVRIEIAEMPRNRLQIRVEDRGNGIAKEILPQLFTPFVTDKTNGTGLGLCLSLRFAREHGGNLSGENMAEGGARFTIELPLARS